MKKIPLSEPYFTEEMKKAAIDALENEFYIGGESVEEFEKEFAEYVRKKYAIAVSSGTAALQLSLIALGLEPGDKVVTSTNSFIASANSIIHAGCEPRFVDIDERTGLMDIKKCKEDDIKAVMPVHIYGQPCDMDEVIEFAKERGIPIIEDACQAHGAEYKGRKIGSIGDVGCFSFYTSKNMIVCGDGGMVVTDDEDIANYIRSLRDCGRISKYEHDKIGYTARLDTFKAAIGRVQLKYLDMNNENRRMIAEHYFTHLPEECLLDEVDGNVYHLFVIKAKNRDEVVEHLKKNGIQTGVHYPNPIHLQPCYRERFGYEGGEFPAAEKFSKEILSLPMYPGLEDDEIEYICEKVKEVLK
ncbi:MAG: DegT/DnrJ/EryC1/StrS family aminotransferase [Candidatus Aenigmatarchaeota archaeon]